MKNTLFTILILILILIFNAVIIIVTLKTVGDARIRYEQSMTSPYIMHGF